MENITKSEFPKVPFFGRVDGVLYRFEGFDVTNMEYYGAAPKEADYGEIGWVPASWISPVNEGV